MVRKIMEYLESWRVSGNRKPLILQGARQVGKTYSILEFGRTRYENVAYFNFETDPGLAKTFDESISPDYLHKPRLPAPHPVPHRRADHRAGEDADYL